jgi:hypothetical protein
MENRFEMISTGELLIRPPELSGNSVSRVISYGSRKNMAKEMPNFSYEISLSYS